MPARMQAASIRGTPLAPMLVVALLLAGCGGGGNKAGGDADLAFTQISPDVFTVVIDPKADVPKTEAALRKHCAGRPGCVIYGWTNAAAVARTVPPDAPHYATLAVRYDANAVGTDDMMWDCLRFRTAKAPCLPKA